MERNTFATSTYIAAPEKAAFDYLRDLRNLNEWTLYSRMVEQMDENTWRGTASGYHNDLYYHVRPIETPLFRGVEWHCGFEYGKYFQCYPALVFPAGYVGSDEDGVYFHWLSFCGPERVTPMIMQGIHYVHTAEIRSLKGNIERRAGHDAAVSGRYAVETSSIFVDAPLDLAAEFLGDIGNLAQWAYFIRPDDALPNGPNGGGSNGHGSNGHGSNGANRGNFIDEYGQPVEVSVRTHDLRNYVILEFEHQYRRLNYLQRSLMMLVPCSYAFGNPAARGCIQHRIAFFPKDAPPQHGKLQIEDYGAESMSLKRVLEQKAGNLQSFALGGSYTPEMVA